MTYSLEDIARAVSPAPLSSAPTNGDMMISQELMGKRPTTDWPEGVPSDLKTAAVLIALIDRPAGLSVVLTRRTDNLARHAGQIAFPGGRTDVEDIGSADTALREACEETALPRANVTVMGYLRDYVTMTGYRITPVVAHIHTDFDPVPEPGEVAEIFEVPFEHLMNPANHTRVQREYQGRDRAFYVIPFGDKSIWGATAGMLVQLHNNLVKVPATA